MFFVGLMKSIFVYTKPTKQILGYIFHQVLFSRYLQNSTDFNHKYINISFFFLIIRYNLFDLCFLYSYLMSSDFINPLQNKHSMQLRTSLTPNMKCHTTLLIPTLAVTPILTPLNQKLSLILQFPNQNQNTLVTIFN